MLLVPAGNVPTHHSLIHLRYCTYYCRTPRIGAALREAEVITPPAASLTTPQIDDMFSKTLPPKTPSAHMAMQVKGGLVPVSKCMVL